MGFNDGELTNYWAHPWSRTSSIANLPNDSNCGVDGRFIWSVGGEVIVPFQDIVFEEGKNKTY